MGRPGRIDLSILTTHQLEALEAAGSRKNVEVTPGAEGIDVMGGHAAFLGVDSPLTHAVGVGVNGPVNASEMDRLEEFYRERGCPTVIEFCPLVEPALLDLLRERRYRIVEFQNVLVANLAPTPMAAPANVRAAERDAWLDVVTRGFLGEDNLGEEARAIARPLAQYTRRYVADADGEAGGGGAMWIANEIAWLFADGTRTAYRGRGLQTALIQKRLQDAVLEGARFAFAATAPNSQSQANYLRCGFRVLYTKLGVSNQE